jgi:hypothetical protein
MIDSLLSGSQTITEVSYECPSETNLLSYINSTVDEPKGIEFVS